MESILGYFEPISLDNWSLEPHLVHHLKIVKKLQQGLTIITVKFVYLTRHKTQPPAHGGKTRNAKTKSSERNHRNETTGTTGTKPPKQLE